MRTAITVILAVSVVGWVLAAAVAASANGRGSDIVRQWVVCRYVRSGVNPYALARDVLIAKYGAGNPGRAKLYAVPQEVPAERAGDVPAELGPPEATYPPPAVGLLTPVVGFLPGPVTVLWVWFVLNVVAVGFVAVGLTRLWPVPPGGGTAFDNLQFVLAALLLFPPTYGVLEAGQFSLLVLGLLLVSADPSAGWLPRGLALGVALLKPSLALPFFFLPLVRREWKVLLVAVAVQGAATAYVIGQTGATIDLFRDWLTVARFFLQGIYTLQDWLNVVSPRIPWLVPAASLGTLALCGLTLLVGRNLSTARLFSLAAVTSVFWTYHGSYDFVLLLPVLLPLAGWSEGGSRGRRPAIGLGLFVILAVALMPAVMAADDPGTRAIRWAGRVGVIGLFAREYLRIWWGVFHPGARPALQGASDGGYPPGDLVK